MHPYPLPQPLSPPSCIIVGATPCSLPGPSSATLATCSTTSPTSWTLCWNDLRPLTPWPIWIEPSAAGRRLPQVALGSPRSPPSSYRRGWSETVIQGRSDRVHHGKRSRKGNVSPLAGISHDLTGSDVTAEGTPATRHCSRCISCHVCLFSFNHCSSSIVFLQPVPPIIWYLYVYRPWGKPEDRKELRQETHLHCFL